jgi:hypothetical protein
MKALTRSLCVALMLATGAAWRVKIVTAKGEVRVILIDAATGRML